MWSRRSRVGPWREPSQPGNRRWGRRNDNGSALFFLLARDLFLGSNEGAQRGWGGRCRRSRGSRRTRWLQDRLFRFRFDGRRFLHRAQFLHQGFGGNRVDAAGGSGNLVTPFLEDGDQFLAGNSGLFGNYVNSDTHLLDHPRVVPGLGPANHRAVNWLTLSKMFSASSRVKPESTKSEASTPVKASVLTSPMATSRWASSSLIPGI